MAGRQADAVLSPARGIEDRFDPRPCLDESRLGPRHPVRIPSLRNGKDAIELAKKAVELSKGNDPIALDVLGADMRKLAGSPRPSSRFKRQSRLSKTSRTNSSRPIWSLG